MTLVAGLLAFFSQEKPKIEPGEKAPPFESLNQRGEKVRLADFAGKKHVLLAFYPMDFTPG